jgi:hypothetical protein
MTAGRRPGVTELPRLVAVPDSGCWHTQQIHTAHRRRIPVLIRPESGHRPRRDAAAASRRRIGSTTSSLSGGCCGAERVRRWRGSWVVVGRGRSR